MKPTPKFGGAPAAVEQRDGDKPENGDVIKVFRNDMDVLRAAVWHAKYSAATGIIVGFR